MRIGTDWQEEIHKILKIIPYKRFLFTSAMSLIISGLQIFFSLSVEFPQKPESVTLKIIAVRIVYWVFKSCALETYLQR